MVTLHLSVRGFVAAACLVLAASPALAHAVLVKSDPQDGQVLAAAPPSVHLTFNEPVQMTRLQAVKSDGTVIRASETWPLANSFTWTLPEALADGGWLISYAVISTDSHPISGTLRVVVGDSGGVTFGTVREQDDALTQYPRFLLLAGILAGAGLLAAGALFGTRPGRAGRRILIASLAAAVVGSAGTVIATAKAAGGGPVALGAAINVLGVGIAVGLAALAAGIVAAWFGRRWLAALAAILAVIGLGLSGHVAAAPPAWLSRPVYGIHVAAAALWLGSLLVLLWRRGRARLHPPSPASRERTAARVAFAPIPAPTQVVAASPSSGLAMSAVSEPADPEPQVLAPAGARRATGSGNANSGDALPRFSRIAPWMIAALIAGGVGLLVLQAGNLETLIASPYGQLLAVKVAIVAVLLALAAWNRWRLTRPALAGDRRSERLLTASVAAELVLFVPILAVTALLGTAVPPRSLAAAAIPACGTSEPLVRSGSDIGLNVTLTLRSACAGRNNIALAMAWEDGRPVDAEEVLVRFSQRALNIEPFDVYLDGKDGKFSVANYDLPVPGEWLVETRILLDEYTLRRVVFRIPLAAPAGA